jgi:hypothetical protein
MLPATSAAQQLSTSACDQPENNPKTETGWACGAAGLAVHLRQTRRSPAASVECADCQMHGSKGHEMPPEQPEPPAAFGSENARETFYWACEAFADAAV